MRFGGKWPMIGQMLVRSKVPGHSITREGMPPTTHWCASQSIVQHSKQGLIHHSQGLQFIFYLFTCIFSDFPPSHAVCPDGTPPTASLHLPRTWHPPAKHQGITHWLHLFDLSPPHPPSDIPYVHTSPIQLSIN